MRSLSPALAQAGEKLLQLGLPLPQLAALLQQNAQVKLLHFMAGVERYRRAPRLAAAAPPPCLWQEGGTRLLDYADRGKPVLVLPSLINRAHILDLMPEHSFLRFLAAQGLRPLLLDWGTPTGAEQHFSLADYIARAGRALAFIGEPVPVIGYCMGGTLAVALAALYPHAVARLAVLAAPWNFHTPAHQAQNMAYAAHFTAALPVYQSLGIMPVDAIQSYFTGIDPLASVQKFTRFAFEADPEALTHFVAVEDWLNDGVPLALPTAQEVMQGWYGRNSPATGAWLAQAQQVRCPALVIIPEGDKIVPPESALALVQQLPTCTKQQVALGHVGLITSRHAPSLSWQPIAQWVGQA